MNSKTYHAIMGIIAIIVGIIFIIESSDCGIFTRNCTLSIWDYGIDEHRDGIVPTI